MRQKGKIMPTEMDVWNVWYSFHIDEVTSDWNREYDKNWAPEQYIEQTSSTPIAKTENLEQYKNGIALRAKYHLVTSFDHPITQMIVSTKVQDRSRGAYRMGLVPSSN